MRIRYNDNLDNRGIEGWYEILESKMVIFISGTNSRADWKANLNAFRKHDILADCKVHSGYKKYATWLHCFIVKLAHSNHLKPKDIYIIGTSMGGGIAQILGEYNNFNIVNIGGPRTTSKIGNSKDKLFYNKGGLIYNIPFWFKKIKNAVCLNDKWRPVWKAHGDYNVKEIICIIKNGN